MRPQTLYLLADQACDGQLKERLRGARAAGESYNTIAQKLHVDGIIATTGETVRSWCRKLGIEKVTAS